MPSTPLRRALSRTAGWLADRKLPRPLRAPVFRAFSRAYGVDLSEVRLPLDAHPSFGAFFARRLVDGARPLAADGRALLSPCDGTLQDVSRIERDTILQAKDRPYSVAELTAGAADAAALEGGVAWTIYLSPRDYHRVHAPVAARLVALRWVAGALYSVAPKVLARQRVLDVNERAVLALDGPRGPLCLVMVAATNVGRIRIVGVEPGAPAPTPPKSYARGGELARFELGSTVVLLVPPDTWTPLAGHVAGRAMRLGEVLGEVLGAPEATG